MIGLLDQLAQEKSLLREVAAHDLHKTVFHAAWYDELKTGINAMRKVVGFGVHTVKALATTIKLAHDAAVAVEGEIEATWVPSDEWCYTFLHREMNLTPRTPTSAPTPAVQAAKQDELHGYNLEKLALLVSQGLPLKFIIQSDEFGQFLLPHARHTWEQKGSKHVESAVKQDKRQVTEDVGELLWVSSACLIVA